MTGDRTPVDEKAIRDAGDEHRVYGVLDRKTNEIVHVNLCPSVTKQSTRRFLAESDRRRQLDDPASLVDGASYSCLFSRRTDTDFGWSRTGTETLPKIYILI